MFAPQNDDSVPGGYDWLVALILLRGWKPQPFIAIS